MRVAEAIFVAILAAMAPTFALAQLASAPKVSAIRVFDEACVQTADHKAALAKAKALGFVAPPPEVSARFLENEPKGTPLVWEPFDGGFVMLTAVAQAYDEPGFMNEMCAVFVTPADDGLLAAVGERLGLEALALSEKSAAYMYTTVDGKRVGLKGEVTGADLKKGLRPEIVMIGGGPPDEGGRSLTLMAHTAIVPKSP